MRIIANERGEIYQNTLNPGVAGAGLGYNPVLTVAGDGGVGNSLTGGIEMFKFNNGQEGVGLRFTSTTGTFLGQAFGALSFNNLDVPGSEFVILGLFDASVNINAALLMDPNQVFLVGNNQPVFISSNGAIGVGSVTVNSANDSVYISTSGTTPNSLIDVRANDDPVYLTGKSRSAGAAVIMENSQVGQYNVASYTSNATTNVVVVHHVSDVPPETVVVGSVGDICQVNTGLAGEFWYKATGNATPTGWVQLTGAGGGSAWLLAGNAGTNPITDFIGTTDATDVYLQGNFGGGPLGGGAVHIQGGSGGGSSFDTFIASNYVGLGYNHITIGGGNSNPSGTEDLIFGENHGGSNQSIRLGDNNTGAGNQTLDFGVNHSGSGYQSLNIGTGNSSVTGGGQDIDIGGNYSGTTNQNIFIGNNNSSAGSTQTILIGTNNSGFGVTTVIGSNTINSATILNAYQLQFVSQADVESWPIVAANAGQILEADGVGQMNWVDKTSTSYFNARLQSIPTLTRYYSLNEGYSYSTGTENESQVNSFAGTYNELRIHVTANTATSPVNVQFRVNNAPAGPVITIPALTAPYDASDTTAVTVSAADLVNYEIVGDAVGAVDMLATLRLVS